jgi:hypothetical protein
MCPSFTITRGLGEYAHIDAFVLTVMIVMTFSAQCRNGEGISVDAFLEVCTKCYGFLYIPGDIFGEYDYP